MLMAVMGRVQRIPVGKHQANRQSTRAMIGVPFVEQQARLLLENKIFCLKCACEECRERSAHSQPPSYERA